MTDYTGIALVIGALGALLSAVAAVVSAIAAARAGRAEKKAEATHTAVNSRMDEFKKLFEETFRMKGAEAERAKTAAAVPVTGGAVLAAEAKARELLAAATIEAARLLAEARQVSINNPTENPVLVKVVGPGVDTPLKVTDDKVKK